MFWHKIGQRFWSCWNIDFRHRSIQLVGPFTPRVVPLRCHFTIKINWNIFNGEKISEINRNFVSDTRMKWKEMMMLFLVVFLKYHQKCFKRTKSASYNEWNIYILEIISIKKMDENGYKPLWSAHLKASDRNSSKNNWNGIEVMHRRCSIHFTISSKSVSWIVLFPHFHLW